METRRVFFVAEMDNSDEWIMTGQPGPPEKTYHVPPPRNSRGPL